MRARFEGYDYQDYFTIDDAPEQLRIIQGAMNHVEEGGETSRQAFFNAILTLDRAAALAIHKEDAQPYRDEVSFFQLVHSVLKKQILTGAIAGDEEEEGSSTDYDEMSSAIRQVISRNVQSVGLKSLLGELGTRVDITELDRAMLERKAGGKENTSLQATLLSRILDDEITSKSGLNLTQKQRFSDKLSSTLLAYENRTHNVEKTLEKLMELRAELLAAQKRGEELGLSEYEIAFYDALLKRKDVATIKDDAYLLDVAQKLTEAVRKSATLDWHKHQDTLSKMRRAIKGVLRKNYPREELDNLIELLVEQAEQFGSELAA